MRIQNVVLFVLRHAIAGALSALFLTVVAVGAYLISAAVGNDLGGPMVPILIPLFAVFGSIATSLFVFFPLSLLFHGVSRKAGVPAWISPLLFFGLSVLFFAGWITLLWRRAPSLSDYGLAALCGWFLSLGFTIYWATVTLGRRLFTRPEPCAKCDTGV